MKHYQQVDASGSLNEAFTGELGQLVRLAPEATDFPPGPLYSQPELPDPTPPAVSSPAPSAPNPDREGLKRQREELKAIRVLVNGMYDVLAPKALLFIAMLAVFILFIIALFIGETKILVAAGLFGAVLFFPTALLYWKG